MTTIRPIQLPYLRHPWPYPSAVCLMVCLARINVLKRHEIASLWVSGTAGAQLGRQLEDLRGWVDDERVAATLRLSPAEVVLAFDPTQWWPEALRSFAVPFSNPLRICADCLTQGYHTHLFQLPWWRRCPLHGSVLRNSCPHCAGPLNGLRLGAEPSRAFHCRHCERDMANTGAIVMASRRNVRDQWHNLVAAHRRWAAAVSETFIVAPTMVSPYCEIDAEWIIEWIHAAGVSWPEALRPFVVETTGAPQGGLKIRRSIPVRGELSALDRLGAQIARSTDVDVVEHRRFPAISATLARTLVRLEGALQRAAGVNYPRLWGERLYRNRQNVGDRQLRALKTSAFAEAVGIRDRGYRLRDAEISLTESAGLAVLGARRSRLAGLASFRLLHHVRDALTSVEELQESEPAKAAIAWWYSHLMVLTLIDATIAATQFVAWPPPDNPKHVLPGWPPVDLDRHEPGHAWVLAATYKQGELTAYLEPVPLARTIRPDMEQVRDLHRTLRTKLMSFQRLPAEPARSRHG